MPAGQSYGVYKTLSKTTEAMSRKSKCKSTRDDAPYGGAIVGGFFGAVTAIATCDFAGGSAIIADVYHKFSD